MECRLLPGRPVLAKPTITDSGYIFDEKIYTVSAKDTNGIIRLWAVQWEDGKAFDIRTDDGTFTHAFKDTGSHLLRTYAVDDEGFITDTAIQSIYIKLGKPSFLSVNSSTQANMLFINDTLRFKVKGSDPNGHVDSLSVWIDDILTVPYCYNVKGDSALFTCFFKPSEAGPHTIRMRIYDNHMICTDTVFTLVIRKGSPVVNKAIIETFWVADNNRINFTAEDTNGTIIRYRIDWNMDAIWDDSASQNTFLHSWNTTFGGSFAKFAIQVTDDDSLTAIRICSVFVRLGKPVIGAGAKYGYPIVWSGDTLLFSTTAGNVPIVVDTTDTNGTVQKFFWDIGRDGVDDSTNTPVLSQPFPAGTATPIRVTARDDDGIFSAPFYFYVYPDEPPPVPIVYTGFRSDDSVTLKWVKDEDARDKGKTAVQILIGYGINSEPSLPLFTEPLPTVDSFATDPADDTIAQYRFKATQSGAGRFRVKFIDVNQSASVSVDRNPF